jgi:hypothetical protein
MLKSKIYPNPQPGDRGRRMTTFDASLDYTVRPCLKKQKQQKNTN